MFEKRKPVNKPSTENVDGWLQEYSNKTRRPYKRLSPNHWQVGMSNRQSAYPMDIKAQGDWVSIAARLTRDVEEGNREAFYKRLLELSGDLNGSHVGKQGDDIIVTREEPREDLNQLTLYRGMRLVDAAHEAVLPEILNVIKKNGYKRKRK